jgi:hypothetical protein
MNYLVTGWASHLTKDWEAQGLSAPPRKNARQKEILRMRRLLQQPTIVGNEGDEEDATLPEMPVEVVNRSQAGRKTRWNGASKVYQEAIRMEREAQRARKASKWQRKQTTGKELDGLLMELGIFFISSFQ